MSLMNPLALWLLPLLAVPWLLARNQKPSARVPVANLYLWRKAVALGTDMLAPRPVRRSWLVAMQTAAIAAVVLSLCQPALTLERRRTTLVIDVSSSMAARVGSMTRLDEARREVRGIVQSLGSAARVRLIEAAASPRDHGDYVAADPRLLSALEALRPTAGAADLASAVVLASRNAADTLVVLSDSARFTAGNSTDPVSRWVTVGQATGNAALVRVVARPTILGQPAGQVLTVVRNFAAEAREATLEISVDGRLARQLQTRLPADGDQTLDIELDNLGHLVTVTLAGDDALPTDNVRSAPVPLSDPIRVALIGPRGSFLDKALEVNPALTVERLEAGSRELTTAAAARFDLLVCDRCGADTTAPLPTLVVSAPSQSAVQGRLTLADHTHPLVALLDVSGGTATTNGLAVQSGTQVILRVGGAAAVTAREVGDTRFVTFGLDLSRRDFVLSPAFPVLIANAVEWLAGRRANPAELQAGEPLQIRVPPGVSLDRVSVLGPDGRPRELRRAGQSLIVTDTGAAGIYRVGDNGTERQVVVNPVVDGESDLRTVVSTSRADEASSPALRGEPAQLTAWFALAGLLCVAVEWRLRLGAVS